MAKGDVTLAHVKAVRQQNIDMHNQLNQIIDLRKGELAEAKQSLYVQIESFRAERQHEIRSEVTVAVDFAQRSLPWWKRMSRRLVLAEAFGYMVDMRAMVVAEANRVKAEVDAEAVRLKAAKAAEIERANADAEAKAKAEFANGGSLGAAPDGQNGSVEEVVTAGPFDRDGVEVKG